MRRIKTIMNGGILITMQRVLRLLRISFFGICLLALIALDVAAQNSIGFRPGESRKSFEVRMKAMGIETERDTSDGTIFLYCPMSWSGVFSKSSWIEVDDHDRVERLVLMLDSCSFDSAYVKLARSLGAPRLEEYENSDSSHSVVFRGSEFDFTLSSDSDLLDPLIEFTAPDSSIPADSDRWISLEETDVCSFLVDTSCSFWHKIPLKVVPSTGARDILRMTYDRKYPGLGYENYGYSLTTFEVDCHNARRIVRNKVDYSEDRHFIRYEAKSENWYAPKEGANDFIINYLCADPGTTEAKQ